MVTIRIIDAETSAMPPDGHVIEWAWYDLTLETKNISNGTTALYGLPADATLPPEVRAVHHITRDQLDGKPLFDGEAFVARCKEDGVAALAAHNSACEASYIPAGLPMICTYKSALRAWPDAPSHSNQALRYYLEDRGEVRLNYALTSPPHRALPDAYITANILLALFNAGLTGKQMVQFTKEPALLPRCPIGEHKGKPWAYVDHGFLTWIVNKQGMEPDFVWNAKRELTRRSTETQ